MTAIDAAAVVAELADSGDLDPEPGCLPEWNAPFVRELPPAEGTAPDLDPALLPGVLGDFVLDAAERSGGPAEYGAAALLCGLGAAIGARCALLLKSADSWHEFPNLWGLAIGLPGSLKSPLMRECLDPIRRADRERRLRWEEIRRPELERAIAEVDVELAQPTKNADPGGLADARARKRDLETEWKGGGPRLLTSDATPEKLAELLVSNPAGILCERDELSGWLGDLEREGRQGARAFFLEGWSGHGAFTVDRIARGSTFVPRVCLSVLGSIQPGPLGRLVTGANEAGAGADGLLQRFQMLVYPAPREFRYIDRAPDWRAVAAVDRLVGSLLSPELDVGAQEQRGRFRALRLAPEAGEFFARWLPQVIGASRAETSPALAGWLAKAPKLFAGVALVFHVVNVVTGHSKPGPVPLDTARLAAAWVGFLGEHARKAFGASETPALRAARALLARIRAGAVDDGDTVRELHRAQWRDLTTPEAVTAALTVLSRHGIARVETVKPPVGRPSRVVRIHPEAIR
ncbi:MAG: DUF3987 domain-containing protein [Thermoanaerobaculia bacterium]|nr:DUF3987 domain-containing protein [Thermoanaerobaculia bacterium]